MNFDEITVPTLLLDKQKCLSNIQFMANKAKKNNILLRPHFKTHQSNIIGKWFKEFGINQITVSSLRMAEYFANDNWKDITIAFPVNIREIDAINSIAEEIDLNLTIENTDSIDFLIKNLKFTVGVFIKIDTGYKRTGVSFDIFLIIDKILAKISLSDKIIFKGFLSHSGHTYNSKNKKEILDIHNESLHKLSLLKKQYIEKYPKLILSTGDTPSCSLANNFEGIDEIRPGNFVFYDLMQYNLSACNFNDIAVAMACPIVAKHADRNEIVIYGGGIHFSKEFIKIDKQNVYGLVINLKENGWKEIDEENY